MNRLDVTATHDGTVGIADREGTVLHDEVPARLTKWRNPRGGLWSWGGTLGPVPFTVGWPTEAVVLLPTGKTGTVIVEGAVRSGPEGSRFEAAVTGIGPPLF